MIYFDNAATGGFKPNCSISAAENAIRNICANPGRSGHRLSILGEKILQNCRDSLGNFFQAPSQRVIFTKNCTEALNIAIFGLVKRGKQVITTCYEHNSVLRPLYKLKKDRKIILHIVQPTLDKPLDQVIKEKICNDTCLIICNAVSNVTGEILPTESIGKIASQYNIPFIIDGAQGGGHIPLGIKSHNASAIALAGHKGLHGILSSGALVLSPTTILPPFMLGGTGTETFNKNQPTAYPERLESGTLNLPAIASLGEGVKFAQRNMQNFSRTLCLSTKTLIDGLLQIKGITCYSFPNPSGIVSFSLNNISSLETADILNSKYDVAVRGGFHCAPLMHQYLGTWQDGLVRVSLAVQNSTSEINYLLKCLKQIV